MFLDTCGKVVPGPPGVPKCADAPVRPQIYELHRCGGGGPTALSLSRNHLDLHLLRCGFIFKVESNLCCGCHCLYVSIPLHRPNGIAEAWHWLTVTGGQATWCWLPLFDLRNSNGHSSKASNVLVIPNASELLDATKNSSRGPSWKFTSLGISKKSTEWPLMSAMDRNKRITSPLCHVPCHLLHLVFFLSL